MHAFTPYCFVKLFLGYLLHLWYRNESDRRKHINQELMLELRKMRQDKHDVCIIGLSIYTHICTRYLKEILPFQLNGFYSYIQKPSNGIKIDS